MDQVVEELTILNKEEKESCEVKISEEQTDGSTTSKKLYIESYGCQMNFSDSEIVTSILQKNGFRTTSTVESADLILLNTCSIREKAEQTVRNRLVHFLHGHKRSEYIYHKDIIAIGNMKSGKGKIPY